MNNKYYTDYKGNYSMTMIKDRSRINNLEYLIKKYIAPKSNLLDIGCGDMYLSKLLPVYHWKGIDINVDLAPNGIKHDLSVLPYPFKNKAFDGAVCTEVMEHLFKPELIYKEAMRLVKPGGIFIVSTPNFMHIDNYVSQFKLCKYNPNEDHSVEHIRHFDLENHCIIALEYGFEAIDHLGSDPVASVVLKPLIIELVTSGMDVKEAEFIVSKGLPSYCPGVTIIFKKEK